MIAYYPSVIAHIFSGLALMFSVIYLFINYKLLTDTYRTLIIILLFSVALGIHGISHLALEKEYAYNPIRAFLA